MTDRALMHLDTNHPTPGLLSPAPSITGSSSSDATAPEQDENVRIRRRPIPRKGHTKSRRGCLNCKRRKVKCPETLPACLNCKRLGLKCEYPTTTHSQAVPTPPTALQSTGGQFTMEDLQFFHHFLFHAYPPLPLKSEAVWQEVASISHHVGRFVSPFGMSAFLTYIAVRLPDPCNAWPCCVASLAGHRN